LTQHYGGVTALIRACPNGAAVTISPDRSPGDARGGQVKPALLFFFCFCGLKRSLQ